MVLKMEGTVISHNHSITDAALEARKVYGYGRASSDKQENSAIAQQTRIDSTVPLVSGQYVRSYIDDGVSAKWVPYYDRPGFRKLMGAI